MGSHISLLSSLLRTPRREKVEEEEKPSPCYRPHTPGKKHMLYLLFRIYAREMHGNSIGQSE